MPHVWGTGHRKVAFDQTLTISLRASCTMKRCRPAKVLSYCRRFGLPRNSSIPDLPEPSLRQHVKIAPGHADYVKTMITHELRADGTRAIPGLLRC